MFKSRLITIQNDLVKRHTPKGEVLEKVITERLNKALESYNEDLTKTSQYLGRRDGLNVLTKYNRRKEL